MKTLSQVIKKLPAERRGKIAARAKELAVREENVKVTIELSRRSVDDAKRAAKREN